MATIDFKISVSARDDASLVSSNADTQTLSLIVPFAMFVPSETSTDVFEATASTYSIGTTYAWEFRDTDNVTVLASASTDTASHDYSSEASGTYYINLVVTEGNLTSSHNVSITVDGTASTPSTCNPCASETAGVCAFDGARGHGAITRHAYEFGTTPTVYQVENASELTAALTATGPRIVIFDAGGQYDLGYIEVMNPYLYIAGESAPNPVIIKADWWHEDYGGTTMSHMLVRHVTFMRDSTTTGDTFSAKTLHNAIFDSCAFLFGRDECFDLVSDCQNITVQNSIFAYGIAGTEDAKGVSSADSGPTSYIGNLYAHNQQRAPLSWGGKHYYANNMFYNMLRMQQFGSAAGGPTEVDIINNIYKEGPMGTLWESVPLLGRDSDSSPDWQNAEQFNIVGNEFNGTIPANQTDLTDEMSGATIYSGTALNYPTCESTLVADTADVEDLLTNIGPHPNNRLSVLQTIIDNYNNDTGITTPITSVSTVGGYPTPSTATTTHSLPASPHVDSGNGFTNLEVWLQAKHDALQN